MGRGGILYKPETLKKCRNTCKISWDRENIQQLNFCHLWNSKSFQERARLSWRCKNNIVHVGNIVGLRIKTSLEIFKYIQECLRKFTKKYSYRNHDVEVGGKLLQNTLLRLATFCEILKDLSYFTILNNFIFDDNKTFIY